MKRFLAVCSCAAILVISAISCQKDEFEDIQDGPFATKSLNDETKAVNSFAISLLKTGYKTGLDELYSPASLSMALSMAADGACGNTFNEMRSVLGVSDMSIQEIDDYNRYLLNYLPEADPEVSLLFANSAWFKKSLILKEEFKEQLGKYYDAEVSEIDPDAIDRWCEEKTNGRIKKMSDTINAQTEFALLNALFFDSKWKMGSYVEGDIRFTPEGMSPVSVKSFYGKDWLPYYKGKNYEMLRIPLGKSNHFYMTILLPRKENGVKKALASFGDETWNDSIKRMQYRHILFNIPEVSIQASDSVKGILEVLGMKTAFGAMAEFPYIADMSGGNYLYINDVLQKAEIDINSNGVSGSAITEVQFYCGAPGPNIDEPEYIEFIADHPFIFTIEENETGVILFAGVKSTAD